MKLKDFITAGFASFLLIFAFPTYNLWPLAWIGLIPLFIAIQKKTPLQSFWIGWTQGALFYLGTLAWIINTMVNYGKLPLFVSIFLLILLALYCGAYTGLFCFFLTRLNQKKSFNLLAAPFIWVSLEYTREHFLTGFPWAGLAYSQSKFLPIIQFIDITGYYGLSFLIVFINVVFFLLLDYFYSFQPEKVKHALLRNNIIFAIVLLMIALSYGLFAYSSFGDTNDRKSLKIALLQGNIEQSLKWDPDYRKEVFNIYKTMSMEVSKENPELIIWPETATPFYFLKDRINQMKMLELSRDSKAHILFGSPRFIRNEKNVTQFNSAYLISPEKKILGQYDKVHLVPFGEYIPLKNLLFFIDKMVAGIGDFGAGTEHTVFSMPEWKLSVLICFEVIFPDLVRRFVKGGAEFLVNITNDAWFGKSAASYQHISMVVFRAVENRRPIIRAANTGITGIIDSRGKILKETDIFVQDKIIGNIFPEKNYKTFYTRYGDLFALSILFITLVWLGLSFYRK